jgi:cytochrome b pre-mRNA-processing protein 3
MILSLFRKDPLKDAADALFAAAVAQAREPTFYTAFRVEDSVEGRFELLTLHVYLLLRRLKGQNGEAKRLAQHVLDALFANLDGSLREMGVGDLSVGRKIRGMAEAFYGRIGAYEHAMAHSAPAALEEALARNVYEKTDPAAGAGLAGYVRAAAAFLDAQPLGRLLGGIVAYPAPPVLKGAS